MRRGERSRRQEVGKISWKILIGSTVHAAVNLVFGFDIGSIMLFEWSLAIDISRHASICNSHVRSTVRHRVFSQGATEPGQPSRCATLPAQPQDYAWSNVSNACHTRVKADALLCVHPSHLARTKPPDLHTP
jgi:hypothetical protein